MNEVIKSFYEPNEDEIVCDNSDCNGTLEVVYILETNK